MGVASLFGSVVLSDAILKIVIHYPLVVVATSNTFVATPLHVPHPSQRGGCIACPSSACVPSPCPPTDPSPTAIQHCLSVPASVVLPDARAPPTARLCLPFARHCVCVCGPCVHPTCTSPWRPLANTPGSRRSHLLPFVAARPLAGGAHQARPRHARTNTWGAWWWLRWCKGEERSHGKELGHGSWPSGWRRSLLSGVRRRRR